MQLYAERSYRILDFGIQKTAVTNTGSEGRLRSFVIAEGRISPPLPVTVRSVEALFPEISRHFQLDGIDQNGSESRGVCAELWQMRTM